MCGRYTAGNSKRLEAHFARHGFGNPERFRGARDRFNIAPGQITAVIAAIGFEWLRWGLVPNWADPDRLRQPPINARAETVAVKPMFRSCFAERRCLVPADGFFEWKRGATPGQLFAAAGSTETLPGPGVLPGGPYHFRRPDREPFAFAGLWDTHAEEGKPTGTFAIVTTTPNAVAAPIHHRMPVILAPEDYARWLDGGTDLRAALELLRPAPDDALEAVPVTSRVGNVNNDHPGLVEPLASS